MNIYTVIIRETNIIVIGNVIKLKKYANAIIINIPNNA